jgi:hypothetical protein
VVAIHLTAQRGGGQLAVEHGVRQPDAIAERRQLQVAVVVADRGCDVGDRAGARQRDHHHEQPAHGGILPRPDAVDRPDPSWLSARP